MMHRPQRPTQGRLNRGKAFRVSVAALATVSLVAACGSDGDGDGNGSDGTESLTIWTTTATAGSGDTALENAVAAFGEEHGVEITVQGIAANDLSPNLVTAVTGGEGPDVAILDTSHIPQLAAGEVLKDITDLSADLEDQFHEGAWQYSQYDGKQFGLPTDSANTALFYNVTMFEEAGLEVPTTWDELVDAAVELTIPEEDQYGYMLGALGYGSFSFWPWLWQNGGEITGDDPGDVLFNSPEGQEAFQFYADLALVHEVAPPEFRTVTSNWDEYIAPFVQERVAMMVIGPWGLGPIRDGNPDMDFAVAPLPQGKEAATILTGSSIAMAANAEDPDLAWELIEWIATSDEMIEHMQSIERFPAHKDVVDSEWAKADPIRQVFVEQMPIARARPASPLWGDVEWGSFANAWDSVIQGQATPSEALESAAEAATETLSSAN